MPCLLRYLEQRNIEKPSGLWTLKDFANHSCINYINRAVMREIKDWQRRKSSSVFIIFQRAVHSWNNLGQDADLGDRPKSLYRKFLMLKRGLGQLTYRVSAKENCGKVRAVGKHAYVVTRTFERNSNLITSLQIFEFLLRIRYEVTWLLIFVKKYGLGWRDSWSTKYILRGIRHDPIDSSLLASRIQEIVECQQATRRALSEDGTNSSLVGARWTRRKGVPSV